MLIKFQANNTSPPLAKGRRLFALCIYNIILVSSLIETISGLESADHDWDVLIFTQQWPVTTCFHWKEENKDHECNLPTKNEVWTIHGIWPTKLETMGPSFCNRSTPFDLDKLSPIIDQLYLFWPDIETGTEYDYLWKHEWLKHGTCAIQIDDLDNEFKYFNQGLDWYSTYFMSHVLERAGINPNSNNTVIGLHTAIIKQLGKNPSIHCLYDNKNDISYLSEIRICFDKSLQLTDCDGVRIDQVSIDYPGGKVNTNCHVSKPIHYPSNVPPIEKQNRLKDTWKFPVVNVYKLVQFLMWCTL